MPKAINQALGIFFICSCFYFSRALSAHQDLDCLRRYPCIGSPPGCNIFGILLHPWTPRLYHARSLWREPFRSLYDYSFLPKHRLCSGLGCTFCIAVSDEKAKTYHIYVAMVCQRPGKRSKQSDRWRKQYAKCDNRTSEHIAFLSYNHHLSDYAIIINEAHCPFNNKSITNRYKTVTITFITAEGRPAWLHLVYSKLRTAVIP